MKKRILTLLIAFLMMVVSAVPAMANDYDDYYDNDDYGYEDEIEEVEETCDHDWSDWEVTKAATVFRSGAKERWCYDCYETQTKEVKKLKPYAKFKKKVYKVKKGKTLTMKASFAKGDKVKKWKSSNKKIATINKKGKLTAKKAGTVKITVYLKSGKKATCKVKVSQPKAKVQTDALPSTVYWTPLGSVYHYSYDCRTLSRSKVINSGSIWESGKPRACYVCGH